MSVARTAGLSENEVWDHADTYVAVESRAVLARGDLLAERIVSVVVDDSQLALIPDEPPPRHANIIGWPSPEQKETRRMLALELAARATLTIRPAD